MYQIDGYRVMTLIRKTPRTGVLGVGPLFSEVVASVENAVTAALERLVPPMSGVGVRAVKISASLRSAVIELWFAGAVGAAGLNTATFGCCLHKRLSKWRILTGKRLCGHGTVVWAQHRADVVIVRED